MLEARKRVLPGGREAREARSFAELRALQGVYLGLDAIELDVRKILPNELRRWFMVAKGEGAVERALGDVARARRAEIRSGRIAAEGERRPGGERAAEMELREE